ncbi:MAG: class I SAM-dependent methyltransferase [Rhodothermales bacterium]
MSKYVKSAVRWVSQGGPTPSEFREFSDWLNELASEVEKGQLTESEKKEIHEVFGEALSVKTLQGISLVKPRGYAGDFEVIDRVYQRSMTTNPELINWDNFLVNTHAARAVRNRKTYFLNLLKTLSKRLAGPLQVLNIASGPARDVFECIAEGGDERLQFVCIEYDQMAIKYAKALCYEHLDRIQFVHANAFRFTTEERFPLVWSAGLFDYFDDRRFKFLLQRLYEFTADGGELVIGNFSNTNPDQPYMEVLMEWELHHRSPDDLRKLAMDCGMLADKISIGQEPEGVNLFLHVRK